MTPRRAQSPNAAKPSRRTTTPELIVLLALFAVLGILATMGGGC